MSIEVLYLPKNHTPITNFWLRPWPECAFIPEHCQYSAGCDETPRVLHCAALFIITSRLFVLCMLRLLNY